MKSKIALLFLVFPIQCQLLWERGEVRVAAPGQTERARIAFGALLDRGSSFAPFATDNLADMLRFELMERNYRIVETNYAVLTPPAPAAAPAANAPGPANAGERRTAPDGDPTRSLLPDRLRASAGEYSGFVRPDDPSTRRLQGAEIARLGEASQFDFFIQGAVSAGELGVLLEVEENALIFLDVYNRKGELLGAINFSVDRESLRQTDFLKRTCARIADGFLNRYPGRPN